MLLACFTLTVLFDMVIANLAPRMILKLRRAGVRRRVGSLELARSLDDALGIAARLVDRRGEAAPAED